ncbi:PREDICTED: proline-, glutamic acid- and leucine-rich protein 1 isoform X2 [Tarenaya hassleriana]|uniref:proline-, glutamic acid- and leucine-rich protein 1 isoform X2 n=1 Tax=Tarenaya hassleriana TaxID=28532 RepID=UPI00053C985E|nr:PREDICTED: proline-, glutamic acid- and leucine-rich protein 1 isoform X2 [Tarenaya hassleriana]
MAAFERFEGVSDVRLKPRILRNLLSEHVPHEKQPLSNPLSLSKVVSSIQTHRLLSESSTETTEQKLIEKWKSVVDDWVDRLLTLVSSNLPDKSWAGICLMGVTCQECSSDRFFTSYSVWFDTMLSHIRNPGGSRIVRVASCTSISDLLTRLARFPHAKKDAVSHASKLIQPIIKLLDEDASEALWEGALHLLCTIVIFFPAALYSNYDKVEAAIASKIFCGKTSDNMLKKLSHFLALLPKAKGDEGSWSLMMQKLLISANMHLNNFFQGLEEETKGKQAISLLVQPGKESPPPLGGSNGVLNDASVESEQLIVSRVSAIMFCCSTMLTSSYKTKVNIPIRSILFLIERVLSVNGSLPRAMSPFMTAIQQELVCAELPTLHSSALDLLLTTIKSIRSQFLPHAASVIRLVTSYFRKCSLPELRIKLYSITKTLLISMGVGMAMHLAQEVVTNATADLTICAEGCDALSSKNPKPSNEMVLRGNSKKRKANTGIDITPHNDAIEVAVPDNHPSSPLSLKIAALEALETLLTIGGAFGSESWRANIDSLLMAAASNACNSGWADAYSTRFLPSESILGPVEFQLASLRALLASLLSPSRLRPAFLAEGLELFRIGKLQSEMEVAEFCAHALLSLEVLIHPRALPLDDLPSLTNRYPEGQRRNLLTSNKTNGIGNGMTDHPFLDEDDDLCNRWLETDDITSNTENQRAAETTVSLPEIKKLKLGENVPTVVYENVQDDVAMVEPENVQEDVPESTERARGHASDETATILEGDSAEIENAEIQHVDSSHQRDRPVKNSLMDAMALAKEKTGEEARDDSDDDSIPSLQAEDYLSSSESEHESNA